MIPDFLLAAWAVVTSSHLPVVERAAIAVMLSAPVLLVGAAIARYVAGSPRRTMWRDMAARNGWHSPRRGRLGGTSGPVIWTYGPSGSDHEDLAFVARGIDTSVVLLVADRGAYERSLPRGPSPASRSRVASALVDLFNASTTAWMRAPGLVAVNAGSPAFQQHFVVLTTRPADAHRGISEEVERWWLQPAAHSFAPESLDLEVTHGTVRLRTRARALSHDAVARHVHIGLSLVSALMQERLPLRRVLLSAVLLGMLQSEASAQSLSPAQRIPLCAGLTITTAVHSANGDYESIKTVRSITNDDVQLTYSTERMVQDMFDEHPTLARINLRRAIRRADLDTATLYLQQYSGFTPDRVPGTTAIGTSSAVLRALKAKGRADLGLFVPFAGKVSGTPGDHPSVYDHQLFVPVRRVGSTTVAVTVDNRRVDLPAIRVAGDFLGDSAELLFLDDAANPLTLAYRYGIGGVKQVDLDLLPHLANGRKAGDDKDELRVVKISTACTAPPPSRAEDQSAGTGASDPVAGMEQALITSRKVDLFQIFFAFNSDTLREESFPTLAAIATVMARHPDWALRIDGHTDNVASDAYNLTLSKRRAAAVRRLLITKHRIRETRLQSDGLGESRPIDTNDTLQGRARNRRVELVRVSP